MKTLAFLLILTWLVSPIKTMANNLSETRTVEIISMEKVPIVSCTINGKTAFFILDSGSDVSSLQHSEAEYFQFDCKKRAHKSITGASGGKQPLYEVSQVDLHIGQQSLQTQFYATDLSAIAKSLFLSVGFEISGIIGMDLMKKYGFEIDYRSSKLTLNS
jgi:hypothetical protein